MGFVFVLFMIAVVMAGFLPLWTEPSKKGVGKISTYKTIFLMYKESHK